MLPDCRRVGVVQFGVCLQLSESCDTPLGDEQLDICEHELEAEAHDPVPVFGPGIFDDPPRGVVRAGMGAGATVAGVIRCRHGVNFGSSGPSSRA